MYNTTELAFVPWHLTCLEHWRKPLGSGDVQCLLKCPVTSQPAWLAGSGEDSLLYLLPLFCVKHIQGNRLAGFCHML